VSLGEHLFLAKLSANLYRGVQAERQKHSREKKRKDLRMNADLFNSKNDV